VAFLDRPCDMCAEMGKKQEMHFTFKCPLKLLARALLLHTTNDSENDEALPGVFHTPFTPGWTSHTFSSSSVDQSNPDSGNEGRGL